MNTYSAEVGSLAEKIERDIQNRGLSPGDRYFTGAEVGELLSVSTASANRAMSLLVDRDLLVRRRRSGTFIGARSEGTNISRIVSVFVMIPEAISKDLPATDMMQGIRESIPGANVHFSFLPEADCLGYIKELLQDSIRSGQLLGVIPISCGREVYRYLLDSDIPTVVVGSLYESMERLGSIDVDEHQVGRLLVSHLFGEGHKKIAVIDNSRGCPGDHNFSDGVYEAATLAGVSPNSILWRFLPEDTSIAAEVRQLLSTHKELTGFLARSPRLARAVEQAIKDSGQSMDRFEIVFQDLHEACELRLQFTHAQPVGSFQSMASQVGEMLCRRAENPGHKSEHIVVPVGLRHPMREGA